MTGKKLPRSEIDHTPRGRGSETGQFVWGDPKKIFCYGPAGTVPGPIGHAQSIHETPAARRARVGVDPAVAAGPFVTTANDITGITIYLTLATLFLEYLR